MARDFDPRPWNLLAGFAVAAGCGSRTISADSLDDGETQNSESRPTSGPIPYYECDADSECAVLELCEARGCQYVGTPPPCDIALVSVPPFEISEPVLNLAFVDVDVDGAGELVVATQTQLHVYESGATMPTSYPRGIDSRTIHAMVGGAFDDMPGDDVIISYDDDQLALHSSDGMGALSPAIPLIGPYALTAGLEAGAFDVEPTADLLMWGSAHPRAQANFDVLGTPLEIASSIVAGWTLVTIHDRLSATMTNRWGMPASEIARMRAGDLDGLDEIGEVAIIAEGNLSIYVSNECLLPLTLTGPAMNLAFGDHDGDGDDELAVHTGDKQVSMIDVE